MSFTIGQTSEDCIKATLRYRYGMRHMKALRNHFAGEGNTTRKIAEAQQLRDYLNYKNERSMEFEIFLTK